MRGPGVSERVGEQSAWVAVARGGRGQGPLSEARASQDAIRAMWETPVSAVLFGSIGTLADTSEQQREAFNLAFTQHGLDWQWDRDAYVAMLATSGGQSRIAEYARTRGESVDAPAVHRTKSELFQQSLATVGVPPRPGVVETIEAAKVNGLKLALVTTTTRANISALFQALGDSVQESDFDLVVDLDAVPAPKPDQAAYAFALAQLGERPADCLAIEDNVDGVASALAAGVACVAFPNANTAGHRFEGARRQVERLDAAEVNDLVLNGPRG